MEISFPQPNRTKIKYFLVFERPRKPLFLLYKFIARDGIPGIQYQHTSISGII
jgi:hypothetical protein